MAEFHCYNCFRSAAISFTLDAARQLRELMSVQIDPLERELQ